MTFYVTVKQSNIHFIAKFGWNLLENDKLMLFQPRQPLYFSAFRALSSPVVCWCLWKEPVCWWWDEDTDLQIDRVTADAWSDHHRQPQPCRQSDSWWRLPPPCWHVLVASLLKWSAKRLSTHQLSYASAGVYGTFSAWCPSSVSPGLNLESLGRSFFSMNPLAFSQFCMMLERWEMGVVFVETA